MIKTFALDYFCSYKENRYLIRVKGLNHIRCLVLRKILKVPIVFILVVLTLIPNDLMMQNLFYNIWA